MSSFCLISNSGLVSNPQNYRFYALRAKSFDRCVLFRHGCASFCSSKSQIYSTNSLREVVCCSKVRTISDASEKNKVAHLEDRESVDVKRKFSLRLRPRLRLLSTRLRRVSIRSALNDFGMFLRKHMKKVTLVTSISFALGVCYLFMKLMSIPSPKIVPYSDLVTSIQSGSATKVLFEEGSRRIYFNTKLQNVESVHLEEGNPGSEYEQAENVVENVEGGVAVAVEVTAQVRDTGVPAKSVRKKSAVPEWQYATRKVDHDESFLLGMMREKGITYSSAPQSALMAMRSILLTIFTLWIPLTPLMWLLYRQLYASNGPAKKRKPSSQTVSFDDVEGVDTAKVELMEV